MLRRGYNIAPTHEVPVVLDVARNELTPVRWGLIPSWSKDASAAAKMINARCETVHEKPAFRSAFKKRRCLVPAEGFYEWQKIPGAGKQPYNIQMKSGQPFAFAGLWESWKNSEGADVRTCTIITTTPNAVTEPIHDRMPVILPVGTYDAWLDPATNVDDLKAFLIPYASDEMMAYPVSTRVGSVQNNDASLIEPLAGAGDGSAPSTPLPTRPPRAARGKTRTGSVPDGELMLNFGEEDTKNPE